jgi:HMG-box domain
MHPASTTKKRSAPAPSAANPNHHSYASLLSRVDKELKAVQSDLDEARELVTKAGWVLSDGGLGRASTALTTTGGHSNTDHIIVRSGLDARTDRLLEYRRQCLLRRTGDDPRLPGTRRRRLPPSPAPPEPPPSGYVVFLGQMTTKLRYARRDQPHEQTRLVPEISRLWKYGVTDAEREYYHQFCREVRQEYRQQHLEYRATGHYTPSERFERNMEGTGLWLRKTNKNRLEMEIATYDSVKFPMRPPSLEEEHRRRELESIQRRKEKLKRQRERSSHGAVQRRRRPNDEASQAMKAATPAATTAPIPESGEV